MPVGESERENRLEFLFFYFWDLETRIKELKNQRTRDSRVESTAHREKK